MDSETLSLKQVNSTSAQMALSAALACYLALYGKVDETTDSEQFAATMQRILEALTVDETTKPTRKNRSWLPCKLNRIDIDDKIILSQRGRQQLDAVLKQIAFDDETERRRANRYEGYKASPLSTRRITGVAAIWGIVCFDSKYLVNRFDEAPLPDDGGYGSTLLNGLLYLSISGLLAYFIVGNGQRWARKERTCDMSAQFRKTMVKAMAAPPEQVVLPLAKAEVMPPDHTANAPESPKLIATPVTFAPNQPIKNTLHKINTTSNIDQYKGYLSAHSSKARKRTTVTTSLILSCGFVAIDTLGLGIPLALRFGLAGFLGIASGAARYYAKLKQNQQKLFIKTYTSEFMAAYQAPLISHLSVYGLQPANDEAGKPLATEVTINTLGVKRQVQQDVDDFLAKHHLIELNGQLLWYTHDRNNNPTWHYRGPSDHPKALLETAKAYAEKHTPKKYQGCNTYFVKEVIFQLREQLGEPAHEVTADREDAFCRPTADFFGYKHTKELKYNHQLMQVHRRKTDTKETNDSTPKLDSCDHLTLVTKATIDQAICEQYGAADGDEHEAKALLKQQAGFSTFKLSQYGINPKKNISPAANQRMLDAYYEKIYLEQERQLYAKQTKKNDPFNKSSDQLFNDLVKNEKQRHEFELNMTGVMTSSLWTALRTTLLACIPLFGITMQSGNAMVNVAETGAACTAISGGITHLSIHHARQLKREARATNQKPVSLFDKACHFFNSPSPSIPDIRHEASTALG